MSNPHHINPYAFFPKKNQLLKSIALPTTNYCELLGRDLEADRISVNYCECEQCPLMPTVKESVCCFDLLKASTKWSKNWTNFIGETDECFTNHKKISKAITDVEQLDNFIQFDKLRLKEKARYTRSIYIDEYDVAEENDKYRFACYRMITMLIHDNLGIGKRVQLPACILVIAFRVPLLSVDFFKNDNYIPSADLLISAYFLVIEFIGHTLMAFNRFTIFWFPLRHDRIWSRNWYIIALIVLPFGHVCYRLTERGIFSFSSGNTVAMIYTNPAMTSLIFLLSAAIFLITTILAAIFNGLSLIKFYFYKQSSNSVSVKDKRLLFLNCIIFVAQVLRTSYSLSRQIFASNESMIAFLIAALPYITDAFAWAGSISLLLLSPTVRRAYVSFYFCNSAIGISSTSVPPVTLTNRKQMTKILN